MRRLVFCCSVYFFRWIAIAQLLELNFDSDFDGFQVVQYHLKYLKNVSYIHLGLKQVPQSTANGGFMLILNQDCCCFKMLAISMNNNICGNKILNNLQEFFILISSSFQYKSMLIDCSVQFMYIQLHILSGLHQHKLPYMTLYVFSKRLN